MIDCSSGGLMGSADRGGAHSPRPRLPGAAQGGNPQAGRYRATMAVGLVAGTCSRLRTILVHSAMPTPSPSAAKRCSIQLAAACGTGAFWQDQ